MKSLLLSTLILASSMAFAATQEDLTLQDTTPQSIKLDVEQLTVTVPYPGLEVESGALCALELSTNHAQARTILAKVDAALAVSNVYLDRRMVPRWTGRAMVYDLAVGTYVDAILLTAPKGKTVKQVVEKILGRHSLVVRALPCTKAQLGR